jgi:type II secretory ATPase GspE/PulE/Tfp pilus assembly ATPase PilB-like protein
MGAEPFLLASTINIIISQRLVRRLCPDCRKEYKISDADMKNLEGNYNMARIAEVVARDGIVKEKPASGAKGKSSWNSIKFYKAGGCEQCNKEGYRGRMGIYEVLEVDEDIKKMIARKATSEEIENISKEKGMLTMVEDGFVKAAQGATSIEEILRVTRE